MEEQENKGFLRKVYEYLNSENGKYYIWIFGLVLGLITILYSNKESMNQFLKEGRVNKVTEVLTNVKNMANTGYDTFNGSVKNKQGQLIEDSEFILIFYHIDGTIQENKYKNKALDIGYYQFEVPEKIYNKLILKVKKIGEHREEPTTFTIDEQNENFEL